MSPVDADPPLSVDRLLDGRVVLRQARRGYRVAIDTVLVAAAVEARAGESVLDMGAGTGGVGLCVAARLGPVRLTAIERHPPHAALLRANLAMLEAEVVEADVTSDALDGRRFAHIVTNPPFDRPDRQRPSPDLSSAAASQESVPLAVWIARAARLLAPGGSLSVIHRADRLEELLRALPAHIGGLLVVPVRARAFSPLAHRVLVRGRHGSRAPLRLHRGLVMHEEDGRPTPVADALLREAAGLDEVLEL
ncbi:MAG: methyltransferase [Geminicoccaceae bacterium]|nr:methyltransferase [Geminicoccaceae bacterium]